MILESLIHQLRMHGKIRLVVRVTSKSPRNEVVALMEDGSLKLKIAAVPHKGRANEAICDFLAAEFGVAKRNVAIVRGQTASVKHVVVQLQ